MKKLAISVLAIAVTCCGVCGMEKYQTTELFPNEFWSDTEMVSKCMAEVKEKVIKEVTERRLEGNPLHYNVLFKGCTWRWICKNFQYKEVEDRGRFLDSICYQFPGVELPFLNIIEELGLEEKYWTRNGPPVRKRYRCSTIEDFE
jgi:hypothetical protein